jgi:hypothetical protein
MGPSEKDGPISNFQSFQIFEGLPDFQGQVACGRPAPTQRAGGVFTLPGLV